MANSKIAVCSMFRDSMQWKGRRLDQVHRYFRQMRGQTIGYENLDFYALEGDSEDETWDTLCEYANSEPNFKSLMHRDVNEVFDSTKALENRITGLASLGDELINSVEGDYDYLLWIESDLIIEPATIERLIQAGNLLRSKSDIGLMIAPMPMLGKLFYDTWAFRDFAGNRWSNHEQPEDAIVELASVGSAALIDFTLIKNGARFEDGAFVKLCENVRSRGGKVYADKNNVIKHPNTLIENRWV